MPCGPRSPIGDEKDREARKRGSAEALLCPSGGLRRPSLLEPARRHGMVRCEVTNMGISKASAEWNGGLKGGKGVMKGAHSPDAPFTLASRFEGAPSSNPEELLGAALAGCFSMALTLSLEQ